MTTSRLTLFGPADVLDLFCRQDGVYLPEVYARASVHTNGATAVVELASTLDLDCERAPERFRVTVERIVEPAPPRGLAAHLRDAGRGSLADALERVEGGA